MRRFIDGYSRLLTVLLALSVGLLVVPVTLQMVARFTALIPAWIWTEEMARFLFIWMVMLGAMLGVREGTHFDVDVWPELTPRTNALLRLVSMFFVLVFALVFVWYGIKFLQFGWNQSSELADLPMGFIFIAWPLTGLTWLLFGFDRLRNDLRILRHGPSPGDEPPSRDQPPAGSVV
jgi:TRAP-type C4-dicarboxylate transport system permease small subunit